MRDRKDMSRGVGTSFLKFNADTTFKMVEKVENALSKRDFSKVILTLENVMLPYDKLSPTPSMLDGLNLDTETDLRILGCELIQTSGILLKLPQVSFPWHLNLD